MTAPEKIRLARRFVGLAVGMFGPTNEQIHQLTFSVSKLLNLEEPDEIHASAKLDFVMAQSGKTTDHVANLQNMVAVLLGLVHGQQVEISDELLKNVGLERKAASGIVVVG